jgi:hypothetical protein
MEKNERRITRAHLVTAMLADQPWQEAAAVTAMPAKRAMAYRLVRAVRIRGKWPCRMGGTVTPRNSVGRHAPGMGERRLLLKSIWLLSLTPGVAWPRLSYMIVEWRDPSASWLKLPLVLVKLVDYTDLRASNQGFMLADSVCVKHGDHERGRHLPSRL